MILFYILLSICIIAWISVAIVALCKNDEENKEEDITFERIYTNEYGYVYIQTNKKRLKNEK